MGRKGERDMVLPVGRLAMATMLLAAVPAAAAQEPLSPAPSSRESSAAREVDQSAKAAAQCGSVVFRRCAKPVAGGAGPAAVDREGGAAAAAQLQGVRWSGPDGLEDVVITGQSERAPGLRQVFERNLGPVARPRDPDRTVPFADGVRCTTNAAGQTACHDPQAGFRLADPVTPTTNLNDMVF